MKFVFFTNLFKVNKGNRSPENCSQSFNDMKTVVHPINLKSSALCDEVYYTVGSIKGSYSSKCPDINFSVYKRKTRSKEV